MMDFGLSRVWTCDECPIVCDLERRLQYAQEDGCFEYFGMFDHCGCDKIDGELWMWKGCEDAWGEPKERTHKGKRKTGRAYRRAMRVQKFNRQKDIELNQNGAMSIGMDRKSMPAARPYQDDVRYTYIKKPHESNRKKFLKRYANKLFRRTDFVGRAKSYNKKVFSVMWEMW